MYVSKNRVAGSLLEVSLDRLLESCHRSLLTGTIRIAFRGESGTVVLRAGAVDDASYRGLTGYAAVSKMRELQDGEYELSQRLPDLSGALGSAAQLDGEVSDVPLAAIMRHCEENALSCTIIVISDFDRGEIAYRAGDIRAVTLNGRRDDEAIVTIVGWQRARFRIQAPPLDPAIEGWPAVDREPTQPSRIVSRSSAPPAAAGDAGPSLRLKDAEPAHLLRVLGSVGGNRARAAALLGISASTLGRKLAEMKRAGVAVPASVEDDD